MALPAVPKAENVITAPDQADDRAGDRPVGPAREEGSGEGSPNPSDAAASSRSFAVAIATAGGVGFLPLAPGTFGALVGVGLFLGLARMGGGVYLLTALALTALSSRVTGSSA